MAAALKVKFTIGVFAMMVLAVIPFLEGDILASTTIRPWGEPLTWNDFAGFPQFLTKYDAEIASAIYLEYDSASSSYFAFAGQNNAKSWVRDFGRDNMYMLSHEQYHFNITEIFSRRLNEYIKENPDGSEYLYKLRLGSLYIDLNKMQRDYDRETDHSTIIDQQRRWEYRIDSLLASTSGWVTDPFSGAKAFFPSTPSLDRDVTNSQNGYRSYDLNRYNMHLSLASLHNTEFAPNVIENILASYKELPHIVSVSHTASSSEANVGLIIYSDSSGNTTHSKWLRQNNYLYCVSARYSNNFPDTTGFVEIANSFVNSFEIVNTDSFWIEKLASIESNVTTSKTLEYDGDVERGNNQYCLNIQTATRSSFCRGPFYRDDGALVLACDYLIHPDTTHFKDILLLNDDWYSLTPSQDGQIFFVPAAKVPDTPFEIRFGYVLKEDSVKDCYPFYFETLNIKPFARPDNEDADVGITQ